LNSRSADQNLPLHITETATRNIEWRLSHLFDRSQTEDSKRQDATGGQLKNSHRT